jgi:hypothetical protein
MVELSRRATTLLKRLCGGETLISVRGDGRFSLWFVEKAGSRRSVIGWVGGELSAYGMVERVNDRSYLHHIGPTHECFRYSVTDAGRAYVAALNAPQELT